MRHTDPGVALVTGASSGIGRAACLALNQAGWTVILFARRKEALEETVRLMDDRANANTTVLVGDLASQQDIIQLFATVKQRFGRLDLLFNNAGISNPRTPLEDLTTEAFLSVMSVNVNATFGCCQEAIKIMKAQIPQGGRIINNGSISAYTPRPHSAPYTMSKHAVLGLTKCIALDCRAYNIACSQLDIGNAETVMSTHKTAGALQADGRIVEEPYVQEPPPTSIKD